MNIIREETTTTQEKKYRHRATCIYIYIVLYCTDEAKILKQYCL